MKTMSPRINSCRGRRVETTLLITLVALSILYSGHVHAQSRTTKLKFESLARSDNIHCIFQDNLGFLWFGTDKGLQKHDGYGFKSYTPDLKIFTIYKDRVGVIWLGTDKGLYRFERETETVAPYFEKEDLENPLSHSEVRTILHTHQADALWVGTPNGLFKLDRESKIPTPYTHNDSQPESLRHNIIHVIHEDQTGTLWIGTNGGLSKLDYEADSFVHAFPDELDKDEAITAIYEDRQGAFWVGSTNGLYKFDRNDGQWSRYDHESNDLSQNAVTTIYEAPDGELWIGTESGINRFDRESERFEPNPPEDFITSLYMDQSGVLWVGARDTLWKVYRTTQKFVRSRDIAENRLRRNYISVLYVDRKGVLWIGTSDGLHKYDQTERTFIRMSSLFSLPEAMYEDSMGIFWVGTAHGIYQVDREAQKAVKYDSEDVPQNLLNGEINAIFEDRVGMLWFGTERGLFQFDREAEGVTAYHHAEDQENTISNDSVNVIYEDKSGILWVGTKGGLNKFRRETEDFAQYRHDEEDQNSLSHDSVNAIYEDPQGTLWIGTEDCLNRFNPLVLTLTEQALSTLAEEGLSEKQTALLQDLEGKSYLSEERFLNEVTTVLGEDVVGQYQPLLMQHVVQQKETFTSYDFHENRTDVICGILGDDDNNLWVSTGNGLVRFTPQTETFKIYTTQNGLPSNIFTIGASHKNSETGQMLFGGNNGFTLFYPENIAENQYLPPVALTSFISDQMAQISERAIEYTKEIRLTGREGTFDIEFVVLNYLHPEENHYAYILEGHDPDWSYSTGKGKSIRYEQVPSGEYTLRMKGANNDGMWNEDDVAVKVIVMPLWWQTRWMGILAPLFLSLFAALFIGGYVLAQHKARMRAENLTKRLRAVNAIGQLITSEIRLPIDEILKGIYKETDQLELITDTMFIALYDKEMQKLRFPVAMESGKQVEYPSRQIELADPTKGGLTEEVLRRKKPLNPTNVEAFYKGQNFTPVPPIPKSWLGVPIMAEDEMLGVIALLDDQKRNAYDAEDLQVLQTMADQAAIAIENARLYGELEAANRKIAENQAVLTRATIAADFVHRMNNIAGTIPVWTTMIEQEVEALHLQQSKLPEYLDHIRKETEDLLRATEKLKTPEAETVNDISMILKTMIKQLNVQYSSQISAKQLQIEDDIEPELHEVWAVSSSLNNAIFNVVSNGVEAVLAVDGPGVLTVKARNVTDETNKEWITIEVDNTGPGLSEEAQQKIFTTFFSTRGKERGYGLWRANTIIQKLGGHVSVSSQEGKGATFTIQLPKTSHKEE